MTAALPEPLIEAAVRAALLEDLGSAGDLTTDALIPAGATAEAAFVAREPGVVCGLDAARLAFSLLDPAVRLSVLIPDGGKVFAGETIATVAGPALAILTGERTALNFLGHLSGVASGTALIAGAIAHTRARVICTRKTLPGLRALQKYAVRCGGGHNHRFGLHDGILIKDNHIALAGGVAKAFALARAAAGHMVRIEIEIDRLDQVEPALHAGADALLLDNMTWPALREAVGIVGGRASTNASGRVTLHNAAAIAETGVDLISVGWITHSATVLDIGVDVRVEG